MTQNNHEQAPFHETDPTKLIPFNSFDINRHRIEQIAGIDGPIVDELAKVFGVEKPENGWDVASLGELISIVGPAKTLQDNIPAMEEILPGVDGKRFAIEWVKQSGLLEPAFRNYENPDRLVPHLFETAVITGGVRNWMMRRAKVLIETLQNGTEILEVNLVAGMREMRTAEGSDVLEGDTEASYMERVIKPLIESSTNVTVDLSTPETTSGNEISAEVAKITKGAESVLVACNAGNWIQNAGQIRRAMDEDKNKVFVVSDTFPVAENDEPPAEAQNPLTAVGIIGRNLQELKRQTQ